MVPEATADNQESLLEAAANTGNNVYRRSAAEDLNDDQASNNRLQTEKNKAKTRASGVPPAPVVFPPASNPETERDRQKVARLDQAGNREAAREYALAALERNPTDPALNAFVKLSEPVKSNVDQKTVRSRIAELAAGMSRGEEAGGAILAAPISYGALAGAASRAPGAGVAGPAVAAPASGGDVRFISPLTRAAGTKLQLGDYAGAETLLTRRLEENPSDLTALHQRAWARRMMKKFDSSAEDARGILTLMPMDMRALLILVQNLLDLGRREDALRLSDRATAAYPGNAHALVARAAVAESLGRDAENLAYLKEAAALDPQFLASLDAAQRAEDERKRAEFRGAGAAPSRPRPVVLWLALIGTALLFISYPLWPKIWSRGNTETRAADRAAAATPRPETVPTGYTLGEQLGMGGMGVVYAGEDRALKRKVAIKVLRPEVSESPRERQRFLKEARTVAKLKHPNIVDIHSVHDENGSVWLVFEHIQGETLHELLGSGKLPASKALNILGQVAAALDYAHGQGVVHQDLKPGNIMIAADAAKVMDFGIARCVRETLSTMSKLEVAGTPAYMAPEQELGGAAAAPAADIFAFGACAYECLSGQMPFPGGHVMIKVEKRYRPLSELAGLPSAVDPVIARALDPEPTKRWPAASAFVAALGQAFQEPPIHALSERVRRLDR